jgi:hypothetical protein
VSTNQPPFDPLEPTPEEDDDMLAGYRDGFHNRPISRDTIAYAHGWHNGVCDRAGTYEPDQIALAKRYREMQTGRGN